MKSQVTSDTKEYEHQSADIVFEFSHLELNENNIFHLLSYKSRDGEKVQF